jgi:hypothetical protein
MVNLIPKTPIRAWRLRPNADVNVDFLEDAPVGSVVCPGCRGCLDFSWVPENLSIHRSKKYDIVSTLDNRTLFSPALASFMTDELGWKHLVFKPVTKDGRYLYLFPEPPVPIARDDRFVDYGEPCPSCGEPIWFAGGSSWLRTTTVVPKGLFRGNIKWGGYKEKNYGLYVDADSRSLFPPKRFRGLSFDSSDEVNELPEDREQYCP